MRGIFLPRPQSDSERSRDLGRVRRYQAGARDARDSRGRDGGIRPRDDVACRGERNLVMFRVRLRRKKVRERTSRRARYHVFTDCRGARQSRTRLPYLTIFLNAVRERRGARRVIARRTRRFVRGVRLPLRRERRRNAMDVVPSIDVVRVRNFCVCAGRDEKPRVPGVVHRLRDFWGGFRGRLRPRRPGVEGARARSDRVFYAVRTFYPFSRRDRRVQIT